MKNNFDRLIEAVDKQIELYRTIRKDLIKGSRKMESKRDKQIAVDLRRGRKNWKDHE
jgi:hypothetical protein